MSGAGWSFSRKNWSFGPLRPTETLFDFDGPAIFTADIGLENLLFYKAEVHDDGDYFIAVPISGDELTALKSGKLSVRGALAHSKCWVLDVDFDLNVRQYEQVRFGAISPFLPKSGVPLYASMKSAPDSVQQATSALAFKFFGDELLHGSIPFGTFKVIINDVYDVVRRSLTPPSLAPGRSAEILDIPLRQPLLASLLIAIDHPSIDLDMMRRRSSTRNLDPEQLIGEAEEAGAKFVEKVEKTADIASAGKLTKGYARDNFDVLDRLSEIIPVEGSQVSKLQISSHLAGRDNFVEFDREVGDKIRFYHRGVRDRSIKITGIIVGMVRKSRTFIVRNHYGREITCYLVPSIYDDLLSRGEIFIGRRLSVMGNLQERDLRDLMRVDGRPTLL